MLKSGPNKLGDYKKWLLKLGLGEKVILLEFR